MSGNVLEEVSFYAEPGKVLGVLGRTGSGKSTLTRLLFRLYDLSWVKSIWAGPISREVPLADLARVVWSPRMCSCSRLLCARTWSSSPENREAILGKRLKIFACGAGSSRSSTGWIRPWPGRRQGLSAGEAQLLAFARVFLQDPGLVILDEASSRLDPATERADRARGRPAVPGPHRHHHRPPAADRAARRRYPDPGRRPHGEYGSREALASNPGSRFYSLLQTGLEEALVDEQVSTATIHPSPAEQSLNMKTWSFYRRIIRFQAPDLRRSLAFHAGRISACPWCRA